MNQPCLIFSEAQILIRILLQNPRSFHQIEDPINFPIPWLLFLAQIHLHGSIPNHKPYNLTTSNPLCGKHLHFGLSRSLTDTQLCDGRGAPAAPPLAIGYAASDSFTTKRLQLGLVKEAEPRKGRRNEGKRL
ncbi:unnamed protein product [Microthlaspi erraticum]|uniref:Uncharacterized protein n=1 Tax=Microthlaspi erraticum TaxID=1685480 RepID=A0A6D2JHL7_9BRAS|nr:unnamed protein product [Microthlaspi erraticum]